MAQQLSFDLPIREGVGREDFYVAPSNAMAVALIDSSPDWPTTHLVLSGPEGSGKTHLAHVWATAQDAGIVSAHTLANVDVDALARKPLAVEDIPGIANNSEALTALFHLFNLALQNQQPLLLTGRGAPRHWALNLADIQSRIDGCYNVTLEAPDDTLLAMVLGKLFADRQITPKPDVIPYLVRHMERSFAAARDIVATLDKRSLDEGRTLSRRLAADLIGLGGEKQ
ncbi:MAG: chromosomal replication initiator DnaA [Arenibacterium sp.]